MSIHRPRITLSTLHHHPHRHSLPSPTRRQYSTPTSSVLSPPPYDLLLEQTIAAPHLGTIQILSLNRAAARNALSLSLLSQLHNSITALQTTTSFPRGGSVRALILNSAVPGIFCAGADLKQRSTFTPAQTDSFLRDLRATFTAIASLPIPTIACVNAIALGGGLELALTAHFRVFSTATLVGLPETRLAILPGGGGTWRLPGVVGKGRARDLVVTGRRVGGREAFAWGLCDRLVALGLETEAAGGGGGGCREEGMQAREGNDGREGEKNAGGDGMAAKERERQLVLREGVRLAMEICEGGPLAIGAGLRAVDGWAAGEPGEVEASEYEKVVGTEDRDEALLAFREKRRPLFKGR